MFTERNYKFIKEMEVLIKANPELMDNQIGIFDMTREERFEFNWKRLNMLMQLKPDLFTENDCLHWYKWCFVFGDSMSPVFQH